MPKYNHNILIGSWCCCLTTITAVAFKITFSLPLCPVLYSLRWKVIVSEAIKYFRSLKLYLHHEVKLFQIWSSAVMASNPKLDHGHSKPPPPSCHTPTQRSGDAGALLGEGGRQPATAAATPLPAVTRLISWRQPSKQPHLTPPKKTQHQQSPHTAS